MRRFGGFIRAAQLEIAEGTERKKVTPEVLRSANEEQVRTFLRLYEPTFRLTKIVSGMPQNLLNFG